MPDTTFTPASQVNERHAMVVALEAPPNSGKTFSGMRLAKGMAEAQGKRWCVIDTEGGRTLHLRKHFDFDFAEIKPPHRPEKYLKAAQDAQARGYGAALIDSFSNVWRGIGGVLSWADEELEAIVERERNNAKRFNRDFDESTVRFKQKTNALIRPKMAFKFMMAGLLDLRMPLVLSIRGEVTYDPGDKKEIFKVHMNKGIGFDVTCRFRLMPDKKGFIDTSDSEKFKMEGDHSAIFKHGEQLSEVHGAALNAWATNMPLPGQPSEKPFKWSTSSGKAMGWDTAAEWSAVIVKSVAGWKDSALQPSLDRNGAELESHLADHPDEVQAIFKAFADRGVYPKGRAPAKSEAAGGGAGGELPL